VLRADPAPVDRPLDVLVLATDWLGAPGCVYYNIDLKSMPVADKREF
jgi:hypothetical protein